MTRKEIKKFRQDQQDGQDVACGEGSNSVEKEEVFHKVISNAGIIYFKLREADAGFGPLFRSGPKRSC